MSGSPSGGGGGGSDAGGAVASPQNVNLHDSSSLPPLTAAGAGGNSEPPPSNNNREGPGADIQEESPGENNNKESSSSPSGILAVGSAGAGAGGMQPGRRVTIGGNNTTFDRRGSMASLGGFNVDDLFAGGRRGSIGFDMGMDAIFGRRDSMDSTTATLDQAILDLTRRRYSMAMGGGGGGGATGCADVLGGAAAAPNHAFSGMAGLGGITTSLGTAANALSGMAAAYGQQQQQQNSTKENNNSAVSALAARQQQLQQQQRELEQRQKELEMQRQQLIANMQGRSMFPNATTTTTTAAAGGSTGPLGRASALGTGPMGANPRMAAAAAAAAFGGLNNFNAMVQQARRRSSFGSLGAASCFGLNGGGGRGSLGGLAAGIMGMGQSPALPPQQAFPPQQVASANGGPTQLQTARTGSLDVSTRSGNSNAAATNNGNNQWWVCQVCNSKAFASHEEAMAHEQTCAQEKNPDAAGSSNSQQQQEQQLRQRHEQLQQQMLQQQQQAFATNPHQQLNQMALQEQQLRRHRLIQQQQQLEQQMMQQQRQHQQLQQQQQQQQAQHFSQVAAADALRKFSLGLGSSTGSGGAARGFNLQQVQQQQQQQQAQTTTSANQIQSPPQAAKETVGASMASPSAPGSTSPHPSTSTLSWSNGPFGFMEQPIPLAMQSDKDWLTPLHCFVRRHCVEVFTATTEDVQTPSKGKRKPITAGQVGIRCPHCHRKGADQQLNAANKSGRERGSVYYPTSISSIYNATMNLLQRHLHSCALVPDEIMRRYETLKADDARSGTSKRYWMESAMSLGLVDTAMGIRFSTVRPPPLPSLANGGAGGQQQQQQQQLLSDTSEQHQQGSNSMFPAGSAGEVSRDNLAGSGRGGAQADSAPLDGSGRSAAGSATGEVPSVHQQMVPAAALVSAEDKPYSTEFSFHLLSQMQRCIFTEADRLGKRKGLPPGFPGLACRHCFGGYGSGRFFPSSIKTLSDTSKTLNVLHNHMMRCRKCPSAVRETLERLRGTHDEERAKMKFGSQKAFFGRIWDRLHGKDAPPVLGSGVGGSPSGKRSKKRSAAGAKGPKSPKSPVPPRPTTSGGNTTNNNPAEAMAIAALASRGSQFPQLPSGPPLTGGNANNMMYPHPGAMVNSALHGRFLQEQLLQRQMQQQMQRMQQQGLQQQMMNPQQQMQQQQQQQIQSKLPPPPLQDVEQKGSQAAQQIEQEAPQGQKPEEQKDTTQQGEAKQEGAPQTEAALAGKEAAKEIAFRPQIKSEDTDVGQQQLSEAAADNDTQPPEPKRQKTESEDSEEDA